MLYLMLCGQSTVFAHRPHDVVNRIELSPAYEADQTLYILVRGNLFKSINGGDSWQRSVKGLDNGSWLSSFCVSPNDSKMLLLAVRGDGVYKSQDAGESWFKANQGLENLDMDLVAISENLSGLAFAASFAGGIHRTEDNGKSWRKAAGIGSKVTAVTFVPGDSNTVWLGDEKGALYRSNDRGVNWEKTYDLKDCGAVRVIRVSPLFSEDGLLFAGTQSGGIFRSKDGGISFERVSSGLSDMQVQDIVISSKFRDDSTIYTSTASQGAFYSDDAGNSWKKMGSGLTKDSQADQEKVPHFYDLRIAPGQDRTMFLGGFDGLFKSTDGGISWKEVETLSPGTITAFDISPTYAADKTLVAATYVGGEVWLSQNSGKTWKPKGFPGDFSKAHQDPRRFFDIAFSPVYAKDRTIFATLLYDKFLKSTNRGARWKNVRVPEMPRGFIIMISPDFSKDKTVFLFSQYGTFYRSVDGGDSFLVLAKVARTLGNSPPSGVISPDFARDRTIFIENEQGVQRSVDGGSTWSAASMGILVPGCALLAISPDYARDGTLFAGTSDGVYKTSDKGKQWIRLNCAGNIESLAVSPDYTRDRTIVASVKGRGLFRSIDGGESFYSTGDDKISFSSFACPHSTRIIQFSPAYASDKTLFATGSAKKEIYRSTDGGITWEALSLPRLEKKSFNVRAFAAVLFRQYGKTIFIVFLLLCGILILHRMSRR